MNHPRKNIISDDLKRLVFGASVFGVGSPYWFWGMKRKRWYE